MSKPGKYLQKYISIFLCRNTSQKWLKGLIDDYGDNIFNYLIQKEKINICDYSNTSLFKLQNESYYNEKNRIYLYHWLLMNNFLLKKNDDTLFMAINIMDRYISQIKSKNTEYPLIAISSYLIASKYEDIYPPSLKILSKICNNNYSIEEIIKKEYEILVGLNFDILYNSSLKFLTFLHSIEDKNNLELLYLSQFILEISLENLEALKFSQSLRALASLDISKKLLKIKKNWNNIKLFYKYDERQIKIIQRTLIASLLKVIQNKENNEIFKKYSKPRYKSMALYVENLCRNN